MSEDKTWRECRKCGTINNFALTMPSTVHCDGCGAVVAETETPVEIDWVGFSPLRSVVENTESGEVVTRVEWDDDRVRTVSR